VKYFGIKFPACDLNERDFELLRGEDELRSCYIEGATGIAIPFLPGCKLADVPEGDVCLYGPSSTRALITPTSVTMRYFNFGVMADVAQTVGFTLNPDTAPYVAAFFMKNLRLIVGEDDWVIKDMTAGEVTKAFACDDAPLSVWQTDTAWRARAYRKTSDGVPVRIEADLPPDGVFDKGSVVCETSEVMLEITQWFSGWFPQFEETE
jgi:hypothetical protein